MSASKPTDSVVLKLGDVTIHLRWDLTAAAVYHDRTGRSFNDLADVTKTRLRDVLDLLYAGIVAHASSKEAEPQITVNRLGSLIDSGPKMTAASEAVRRMFDQFSQRATGEGEEGKGAADESSRSTHSGSDERTKSAPSISTSQAVSSGSSPSTSSSPESNDTRNVKESAESSAEASSPSS